MHFQDAALADAAAPLHPPVRPPRIRWRVRVLDSLEAHAGLHALTRFPSRPVALLLARLAMAPHRRHAREELIELLWPGLAPAVGRSRFRPVLATLRRLLDASGDADDHVLQADHLTVRLCADAVRCDLVELENASRGGDAAAMRRLKDGVLLPGYYDEWILEERERLARLPCDMTDVPPGTSPSAATGPTDAPRTPESRQLMAAPSPLPLAPISDFFGGEEALAELRRALTDRRLVTLRGAPGIGKSRLADEAAGRWSERMAVVRVDFAQCGSADRITAGVCAALPPAPNGSTDNDAALDPRRCIDRRMGARPWLCVLDHFEHLVDGGGAEAALDLLRRWPAMRLLVVSRRALQVPGECEVVLGPWPLPETDDARDTALANPCVALFVDRVRNLRGGFRLQADDLWHVVAICRAVGGHPLAIVLAAARARTTSLAELRGMLEQGAPLDSVLAPPNGRSAAAFARQRSLTSALEPSWRLLTEPLQRFAVCCSAWRGPVAIDDLVAQRSDRGTVQAQLAALAADSLLQVHVADDGSLRFCMPGSVATVLRAASWPARTAEAAS